ncbi:MAG: hypothetical protein KDD25_10320, partial [Bdellovibrionales bacterium]|nr:hypothetical protein [Bdellovibrionales bacterium]
SGIQEYLKSTFSAVFDPQSGDRFVTSESLFLDGWTRAIDLGLCRPLIFVPMKSGVLGRFRFRNHVEDFFLFIQSHEPLTLTKKIKVWQKSQLIKDDRERHINSRPILSALESLSPEVKMHWLARTSSDNSVAIQMCVAQCYEEQMGLDVPVRAKQIRDIFREYQRITWALKYIVRVQRAHGTCDDFLLGGLEFLAEMREKLGVNRTYMDICRIGGVAKNLTIGEVQRMKSWFSQLEAALQKEVEKSSSIKSILKRYKGDGIIDMMTYDLNSWGGPIARSAGSVWDQRAFSKEWEHDELLDGSDKSNIERRQVSQSSISERLQSVLDCLWESFRIVKHLLYKLDTNPLEKPRLNWADKIDGKPYFSGVEGADGPVFSMLVNGQIVLSTNSMRNEFLARDLVESLKFKNKKLLRSSLGLIPEEMGIDA